MQIRQAPRAHPVDLKSAIASAAPRNTSNTPLKEVLALAEVSTGWTEVAMKLAEGAGETPTFLEQMARERVLARK